MRSQRSTYAGRRWITTEVDSEAQESGRRRGRGEIRRCGRLSRARSRGDRARSWPTEATGRDTAAGGEDPVLWLRPGEVEEELRRR